uniref:Putative metalloprotease n=1 Tax=Ixodes ricinus TaxID=34613 RepID=A0A0K8RER1_IXORI
MKVDSRLLTLTSTILLGVVSSQRWNLFLDVPPGIRHIQMMIAVLQLQRIHIGRTCAKKVNLYFLPLRCSNVKLVLNKVVNSTTDDEMKFEEFKNTTRSTGRSLDPHLTLGLFREWATDQSFFNDSDVVYLITGHPVFDFVSAYRLTMKAASYAFGVCSRWRVALSSDDGRTFSGVPAAVQQIANFQESCYKLDLSSAETTPDRVTPYTFFNCIGPCKDIIEGIKNNACNVPTDGPENCKSDDICKIDCCPEYNKHFNKTKAGAPDGMPCGASQVCLQRACVNVPGKRSEVSTAPTGSET